MTVEIPVQLELRGGSLEAYYDRHRELLVEGPAGTGKTRAILERMDRHANEYPGYRGLITRKTAVSLNTSCLKTLENYVFYGWDKNTRRSLPHHVHYFGGSGSDPEGYYYDNGSVLVIGGMDQASKVLSTEYSEVFVNEATELTVEDWETLASRCREPSMGWNALIGDCNPSARSHWLNVRCDGGLTHRIRTRLQDNPAYFYPDGTPTDIGQGYVDTMAGMTGSRRERLWLGLWTGVENAIYPHFERSIHVRPLEPGLRWITGALGIDYGEVHSCGVVPITIDQYGRRWVREAWGQPETDHSAQLDRMVGQMRSRYGIYRGMVDPNQARLARDLGFKLAPRPRNPRIQITSRLLNTFPGGRVPSLSLERDQERFLATFPQPPFKEPDTPGLLFVEGAPGIDELSDQIEAYHEVFVQNEVKEDYVVARIDEDLVAAMEYGNQCLEIMGANISAMNQPQTEETYVEQQRRKYTRQPTHGGYNKI